jgi:hypothetical protein
MTKETANTPRTEERSGALVFWLPPEEAALRFGVPVDELVAATRKGELQVRANVAGGELVATLCSTELIKRYGMPVRGKLEVPVPEVDQTKLRELRLQLSQQKSRIGEVELKNARLDGELKTADRVERSLQRYADKVEKRLEDVSVTYEAKLQEAERIRLNMARAIGRMETEMLVLQQRVDAVPAAPLALKAALSSVPQKAKRRWFFGR